jgi:hypothetical protein
MATVIEIIDEIVHQGRDAYTGLGSRVAAAAGLWRKEWIWQGHSGRRGFGGRITRVREWIWQERLPREKRTGIEGKYQRREVTYRVSSHISTRIGSGEVVFLEAHP